MKIEEIKQFDIKSFAMSNLQDKFKVLCRPNLTDLTEKKKKIL